MEEITQEFEKKLPKKIVEDALAEAKERGLSKEQIKKVLDHLKELYDAAKITPGESIGIVTAESFGEPSTQMTLNVFHFAGVAEVSVTQGLPRLIEILDARKTIKTPSMEIYIRKEWNKDIKSVKRIAAEIKETKLKDIVTEFMINIGKLQVEATLHEGRMKDLRLTAEEVAKTLRKGLKGVNVTSTQNKITMKCEAAENELLETYKLKEKTKQIFIKGIKGIKQVLPVKKENEFFILTAGSNLKDVLAMEEIDETKTRTNDLFEALDVLGIEAARRTIIDEVKKVIDDQGLDVDIRHIMLIADIMTNSGSVKGITRSGITGGKRSVLARASFETPIVHIINAAFVGEEDELNSVIENVMLNQPVPLGTGLPGLVAKMKRMNEKGTEKKEKEK